jgi:hypothetical protein
LLGEHVDGDKLVFGHGAILPGAGLAAGPRTLHPAGVC